MPRPCAPSLTTGAAAQPGTPQVHVVPAVIGVGNFVVGAVRVQRILFSTSSKSFVIAGTPGSKYRLECWLRGMCEQQSYLGGVVYDTRAPHLRQGGTAATSNFDRYTIAWPGTTLWGNHAAGVALSTLDDRFTVPSIAAGDSITITANAVDGYSSGADLAYDQYALLTPPDTDPRFPLRIPTGEQMLLPWFQLDIVEQTLL